MAPRATLIVSQPGHQTRKLEISSEVTTIGRNDGNSVRLRHDRKVSRYHAEITLRDDGYWLTDLTTRNGTTINDLFIESEQKLVNGDVIRLGGTSTIEVCLGEENGDKAPPPASEETTDPQKEDSPIAASPSSQSTFAVTMIGILGGIVLIGIFGGILWASGFINRRESEPPMAHDSGLPPKQSPSPDTDERDIASTSTPEPEQTEIAPANPTPTGDSQLGPQAGDAQILAAKISPKNYRFDPAFVVLIGGYVNEYKSAGSYYSRAKKHRDGIDKEFVNIQGLPPVFAYVIAMSRTKLQEQNGDIWDLPNLIVKAEGPNSTESDPTGPARSTKVAASYIRSLWDVFGKEGFMYVVACYGMTLDQAGEVQQRLEINDPTGQARYDFWRMKNLGVVNGEQTERVARFFAAGIVIENPQQFGLNEPPLSTLY
jgi:hypothetical protein